MSVRIRNRSAVNRDLRWTLIISSILAVVVLATAKIQRLPLTHFAAISAADFKEVEASLLAGSGANAGAQPVKIGHVTALFGMDTESVNEGEILKKWEQTSAGIARELQIVEGCRTSDVCPAAARRLIDLSLEGVGRSDRAKVGLINRAVDLAIRPVSDQAQWHLPDQWSTAFETLQSGQGDCEDYAIVKYLALLQAGLSADDLRIVIVTNVFPEEDHAMVAARVDGEWLILDSRTLTLVRDTDLTRAVPKLVLDQAGVRRFVSRRKVPRVG